MSIGINRIIVEYKFSKGFKTLFRCRYMYGQPAIMQIFQGKILGVGPWVHNWPLALNTFFGADVYLGPPWWAWE